MGGWFIFMVVLGGGESVPTITPTMFAKLRGADNELAELCGTDRMLAKLIGADDMLDQRGGA